MGDVRGTNGKHQSIQCQDDQDRTGKISHWFLQVAEGCSTDSAVSAMIVGMPKKLVYQVNS